MTNVSVGTVTDLETNYSTTTAQTTTSQDVTDFRAILTTHSVLFFSLFIATSFILIIIIAIYIVKKISSKHPPGPSASNGLIKPLISSFTESNLEDGAIGTSTFELEALQPATLNVSLTEDDISEAEYDYPELFQFRRQLEMEKGYKNSQETKHSTVVTYVNVNLADQHDDDNSQYLNPRQCNSNDDTDEDISADLIHRSEDPIYDLPNSESEYISKITHSKLCSRVRDSYVKVKAESPQTNAKKRVICPHKKMLNELELQFQKKSKATPTQAFNEENPKDQLQHSCCGAITSERFHNMTKSTTYVTSPKVLKVQSHAKGVTHGHLPTKKIIKRRYENIPDE